MKIIVFLVTIFFGRKVGIDEFGNYYYTSRVKIFGKKNRWVVYKGISEPSKVPPAWEIWLRYMEDSPLEQKSDYLLNITGTKLVTTVKEDIRSYNNYDSFKG